eukprot:IDg2842t1
MAKCYPVLILVALALSPSSAIPVSARQEVIEVDDPMPSIGPLEPVQVVDLFSGLPTRVLGKKFQDQLWW